jgi:hypothetical protein
MSRKRIFKPATVASKETKSSFTVNVTRTNYKMALEFSERNPRTIQFVQDHIDGAIKQGHYAVVVRINDKTEKDLLALLLEESGYNVNIVNKANAYDLHIGWDKRIIFAD